MGGRWVGEGWVERVGRVWRELCVEGEMCVKGEVCVKRVGCRERESVCVCVCGGWWVVCTGMRKVAGQRKGGGGVCFLHAGR